MILQETFELPIEIIDRVFVDGRRLDFEFVKQGIYPGSPTVVTFTPSRVKAPARSLPVVEIISVLVIVVIVVFTYFGEVHVLPVPLDCNLPVWGSA